MPFITVPTNIRSRQVRATTGRPGGEGMMGAPGIGDGSPGGGASSGGGPGSPGSAALGVGIGQGV